MEDIAPALLEDLQQAFAEKLDASEEIRRLLKAIRDGTGGYIEAGDYAWEVGDALAKVFGERLSSAVLPDGRMYYNIADRAIRPLLEQDHALVADAARTVQQHLNEKAELGLKAQAAPLNVDRIDGIIDRVSAAESFDDVSWLLGDPVRTFSQSIVDDTLKANMDFQGKAGLSPRIIRKATGKCCEWCQALAGVYRYPDTPDDVYRRHNNCRCTLEYDGGDAKNFRNVWTKKWTTAEEHEQTEYRKQLPGLDLTPSIKKPSQKVDSLENVTAEYLRNAAPGSGILQYDAGYNVARHSAEIKTAQWLHENLGGDIVLLQETGGLNEKMPDYLWQGKYWELKSVSTGKAVDSALRSAFKQITDNPGGVVISCDNNVSIDVLTTNIRSRITRSAPFELDVLVIQRDMLVKALRYKK
jgi:hypothetical protein